MKIARKVVLAPIVKANFGKICQLYAMPRLDIMETFSEGDTKALEQLVRMVPRQNVKIVEIGSWKGFSTSILARNALNYHGHVYAVDNWKGNEGTWNYVIAGSQDIYSIFRTNMILLGVWDAVHPLVMDSETASKVFADGILDLVFIDADHRYEYVKQDILSWLPKLRSDGILCGHDCEGYYSKYSAKVRQMIDKHLEDDYIPDVCHPGVVKALHDCLGEEYSIAPDSKVWYCLKNRGAK